MLIGLLFVLTRLLLCVAE